MPRLNIFEIAPTFLNLQTATFNSQSSLLIQGVYIPGSISFNNVALLVSQLSTSRSLTISIGLYSLTGSTLSLANSASRSFNTNTNGLYWVTLVTSATQDITPGNWYFGFIGQVSGAARFVRANTMAISGVYGGGFVWGVYSTGTTAFPASIATSDMNKVGSSTDDLLVSHPYILIAA